MSAIVNTLVNALDNYTGTRIGENGSSEFEWSNSFKERIVQLSFQLTRISKDNTSQLNNLASIYKSIIHELNYKYKQNFVSKEEYLQYMSYLYRLIAQTRDVIDGKGEYTLSYMLIDCWAEFNQPLAEFMFSSFVLSESADQHPFGSWKDIKGFYKYNNSSPLISHLIQLINKQLRNDMDNFDTQNPSLAAKWVPREKSAQGNLFTVLALDYFYDYIVTAKCEASKKRATLKAKTDYRKLISKLNKKLDTVQIKQCANTWSEIEPSKQTAITMHKQKKAFLNLTKKGEQRVDSDDRVLCAKNFTDFAAKAEKGEVEVKGKRLGLNDMVSEAINSRLSESEKQILNAQWKNNSEQNGALGKMIAMVDVSGSMSGDPMNAAIGLGLRIAEKSMLGKRVLTFSASPKWVNFDGFDKFTDMVSYLQRAEWGMNTNFASALNMILDAIIQNKLDAKDVEDMVLVILSDMQMDQADNKSKSLMESIEKLYADAGIRVCGTPYKAPHILFWNLRSTNGFPTLSTQKNASMMAGFSPALLNLFCEEGLESLQSCTPWSMFIKSLSSDRYKKLDEKMREVLA